MTDKELLQAFYKDIKEDNSISLTRTSPPPSIEEGTFKQYIEYLPERYRELALRYHDDRRYPTSDEFEDSLRGTMVEWDETHQGRYFWNGVALWGNDGYHTLPDIP